MSRNLALAIAVMTVLLVAVLFEDNSTLPMIANATGTNTTGNAPALATSLENGGDDAPAEADDLETTAPAAAQAPALHYPTVQSEPEAPFVQPEPLK